MAPQTRVVHNLKEAKAEVRNAKRMKVFELFKAGKTAYYEARELKINKKTVYVWYEKFSVDEKAIDEKRRGPQKQTAAASIPKQSDRLDKDLRDNTPDQLMFDFAWWSSKAIQEYVQRNMGVAICRRTARRYVNNFGFTYKRPERRAREQNRAHVSRWLNETYPEIKRKAKRNAAIVMWADETANMTGGERRAVYSPKGTPPILRTSDKRRFRYNSISAISNKGELKFMFFQAAMNAGIFKNFCRRLIESIDKPLYLIVDNLGVHHAGVLKSCLNAAALHGNPGMG